MVAMSPLSLSLLLLQLASLSASVTFIPPPRVHHDITATSLWRCHHDLNHDTVHSILTHFHHHHAPGEGEGQPNPPAPRGLQILSSRTNQIEFLSSYVTTEHLSSLGLKHCDELADMGALIGEEVRGNPDILRYHASSDWLARDGGAELRRLVRRSIQAGEDEGEGIDGEIFEHYEFDKYLNFTSLIAWYEGLASKHPTTTTFHRSIGQSHYGRDIAALHITDKPSLVSGVVRQKVYVQCLLHAREWISGPVCMYIAKNLVENKLFAALLHRLEIVIVPVANPDGYYVTWYHYPRYRLWRKNVSPIDGTECAGVDLNRNFNSHWHEYLANSQSDHPCDECYRGSAPATELEVKAITDYIESFGHSLLGVIDFHSYYQEVVYPPAYSNVFPEGLGQIQAVSDAVAASTSLSGAAYSSHKMADVYFASGTFPDWLYDLRLAGKACPSLIPLTFELRPNSTTTNGFLLPQSQIYPTCAEVLVGFIEFVERVMDLGKDCHAEMSNGRP